jgi:hypothetical protein
MTLATMIAQVCHEANRAYCVTQGDDSQPSWDDAPDWQRESAIAGVTGILDGRITSPEESHCSWLVHKTREGWTYGPVKCPEKKEHPCMVPYPELPAAQRRKDHIFHAIVNAWLEAV